MCGTDGNTYSNMCQLGQARDCGNPDLEVKHQGPCHVGEGHVLYGPILKIRVNDELNLPNPNSILFKVI